MKGKLFGLIAVPMAVCALFALTACEGLIVSSPHKHSFYGAWVTAVQPTCTEKGEEILTCSVCGAIQTQEIAALGHFYECILTKKPTCTQTGVITCTCLRCGDVETQTEEAHGHLYADFVEKAATCTENGVTRYTCSYCGDSYREEVPAAGHVYNLLNVCDVCGEPLHYSQGLEYTLYKSYSGAYFYGVTDIGDCTDTDIVIPYYHEHLPVTRIGENAFYGCSELKSITVGSNITSICYGDAFRHCGGLTDIFVNENNEFYSSIDGVLYSKDQRLLCYPAGKTQTSYTIPNGVQTIACAAFSDCVNLTEIFIPNSIMEIEAYAFEYCAALQSVTIPECVTKIGDWAFFDCSGLTEIVIPNGVTEIGSYAFAKCTALKSVTLPDNVTKIAAWTFFMCSSLTEIVIPNGVTEIGRYAFYNCAALTSVTLPESAISIGALAFYGCGNLREIVIPANVEKIEHYAFAFCNRLESVTFENPAGWTGYHRTENETVVFSEAELTERAARYLTKDYYRYDWRRS